MFQCTLQSGHALFIIQINDKCIPVHRVVYRPGILFALEVMCPAFGQEKQHSLFHGERINRDQNFRFSHIDGRRVGFTCR